MKVQIKKIDADLQNLDVPQVGEISPAWVSIGKIVSFFPTTDKDNKEDCTNITFVNGESLNVYGETVDEFLKRLDDATYEDTD